MTAEIPQPIDPEFDAAPQAPSKSELMELVYTQLRTMAGSYLRRERPGHTLQATALVHEAYLRISELTGVQWASRAHFFAFAAEAIRRVLVDHARRRNAAKRGSGRTRLALVDDAAQSSNSENVDVLDLHDALGQLAELHPRQGRIVELRFFGGLTVNEVAVVMGISPRTVHDDWILAKTWLGRKLHRT